MAASFDIEAIVLDPSAKENLHRQLYHQTAAACCLPRGFSPRI